MIFSVRNLRLERVVWYTRRASQMSPGEVVHRTGDVVRKLAWRHRRAVAELPAPAVAERRAVRLDVPAHADHRVGAGARQALLAAADRLLVDEEWTLFGYSVGGFGRDIDWFRDPKTGVRGFDRTYCFDVPYRDEELIGNVKFLWEMSRHQHLTMLAAAFRLSGDTRYADRAADHLRSWWRANPFLTGVHWCSGIELGIRLISWIWIRRLLSQWPEAEALFERNGDFVAQLFRHQQFLSAFQSQGSSANNHLIAEAAGLFAASVAFPLSDESQLWRDQSAHILEREIVRQTDNQGLNRELATDYHGFVLELLLAAGAEGDAAGAPLSDRYWGGIQKMMDALASVVDVAGRPPRQGDADDGVGLLLDAPEYDRWASLLATGSRLFGRPSWWPTVDPGDVRTAFLSALAAPRHGLGNRPDRRIASFDEAGLAILRDDTVADAPELWCRCDHGPHGFLSIAAHAHADALSIEVRHGGVDVLADPGTYCYHGEPRWRRYFRSTLGHNALELGGIDQAVSAGPFLWLSHPVSHLHALAGVEGGPDATWHASHDGYARSLGAIVHRRVRLERGKGRLLIEDWIESARPQSARLPFHLGPSVGCRLNGNVAHLEWRAAGRLFVGVLQLPQQLAWTVHRGDDVAGWYSPGFARKCPSTTLIGEGQAMPQARLLAEFLIFERRPAAAATGDGDGRATSMAPTALL
jgi:hypothetical protein